MPTYTWSRRCYGSSSVVYMRMEDGSLVQLHRPGGTSQGDPASPGNQCMGMQEAVEMAQLEFSDVLHSRQFYFMDDGTLVASITDMCSMCNTW